MTAFSCSAPRFEISDLAPEIARLPSEALYEVNRDMFGLEEPSPENESIFAALRRMDEALNRIVEKTELIQATILCPDYVDSQEFRLMFLRSENLDPEVSNDSWCASLCRLLFALSHIKRKLQNAWSSTGQKR